jgi:hypothetical protein
VVHVCNPAAGKVEVGGLWLKANPGKVRLIWKQTKMEGEGLLGAWLKW